MPRQRDTGHLHRAISVILDRLDLNLPSSHVELHRLNSDESRLHTGPVGENLTSRSWVADEWVLSSELSSTKITVKIRSCSNNKEYK